MRKEIDRAQKMTGKFVKAGLVLPLARDVLLSPRVRPHDFVEDMRRLIQKENIDLQGIENIPVQGGGLIIFNHPESHVIAPAVFALPVALNDYLGRDDLTVLMGFRLRLFGNIDLPGSPRLIDRFAELYPGHFLLVAGDRKKKDFKERRHQVKLETVSRLSQGHLAVLSPEAQISVDGTILPTASFRRGSGEMGIICSELGIPIIPMGVWQAEDTIKVRIGESFKLTEQDDPGQAVIDMMGEVAKLIPENLRGPYQ